MAAPLATSNSYAHNERRSDSPTSWMEDVVRQQQQHQVEGEGDWTAEWAASETQQQDGFPVEDLNQFGNREMILEQYRIVAEHEAYLRLKKITGLDMEEYRQRFKDDKDNAPSASGRIDAAGYRRALLTPRFPEPRRVTVTNSIPKLHEPTLPPLPRNIVSDRPRSQIAPEVSPGVIFLHGEEVPLEEKVLQCYGCRKKLRVKQNAMIVSCPNCGAENPSISGNERVQEV